MGWFDIRYSLNNSRIIQADTLEEAEAKLKQELEKEGVSFDDYTFEPYEFNEMEGE